MITKERKMATKGEWSKSFKNRIVEKRLAGNKIEITVDSEAELRRRLQDAYTTVSRSRNQTNKNYSQKI